jgi:hypothetical protein
VFVLVVVGVVGSPIVELLVIVELEVVDGGKGVTTPPPTFVTVPLLVRPLVVPVAPVIVLDPLPTSPVAGTLLAPVPVITPPAAPDPAAPAYG